MKRGEIWWAELAGDAGFRPIAILSRSDSIQGRYSITIAEVSRVIRSLPSEVPLFVDDGMPTNCVVNTNNIHTIPKDRLRQRITLLQAERIFALGQAIRYSLDLEW